MSIIIEKIYNHIKEWYGMARELSIEKMNEKEFTVLLDKFFDEKIDYILLLLYPTEPPDDEWPYHGHTFVSVEIQGQRLHLKVPTPLENLKNLENKLNRAATKLDTFNEAEINQAVTNYLHTLNKTHLTELKKNVRLFRLETTRRT